MAAPIPLLPDLARLTQAALFNARELLADARKLADAGSWPRAHALAVLALEETGKAGICVQAMAPLEQRAPEAFWKAFKSHEDKLEIARGVLEILIREPVGPIVETFERLGHAAKSGHVRKMGGLYVGYDNGRIATPDDISATEAQTMIADAQLVLDFHMQAWGDADAPARVVERLAESGVDLGQFMVMFREAMEVDADTAVRRVGRFIREQIALGLEGASAEPGNSHGESHPGEQDDQAAATAD